MVYQTHDTLETVYRTGETWGQRGRHVPLIVTLCPNNTTKELTLFNLLYTVFTVGKWFETHS